MQFHTQMYQKLTYIWVMIPEKFISVFDMFKIAVGPSSSHTLGPWRAAQMCLKQVASYEGIDNIQSIQILLYGSLAKTGKGHGTDMAILMGLMGEDPIVTDTSLLITKIERIKATHELVLNNTYTIPFTYEKDIQFLKDKSLPHHPNAMQFLVQTILEQRIFTYYSIGGGFVEEGAYAPDAGGKVNAQDAGEKVNTRNIDAKVIEPAEVPFNFLTTDELVHWCMKTGFSISDVVRENEKANLTDTFIDAQLDTIWNVMQQCVFNGCKTEGILPGGLQVRRRAFDLNNKLLQNQSYTSIEEWSSLIKKGGHDFKYILDWVSCFALAVNEENASFGRVVTAPTNGAAGVIPAVLFYAILFCDKNNPNDIRRFLLTASAIGVLFKNGATISAAMGGCQAEIGVSAAMAAAALTELLGGNQKQALMAAEIAMEHHLGLTCDPVGGLVQIPCIERNTMGAIKAITAAQLALQSKPDFALVSLDKVIKTMWNTALDMNVKYKETADGGLAIQIPIALAEC